VICQESPHLSLHQPQARRVYRGESSDFAVGSGARARQKETLATDLREHPAGVTVQLGVNRTPVGCEGLLLPGPWLDARMQYMLY
jgi:hypothetical protein